MTATSPSDAIDTVVKRDASLSWGWVCFVFFGSFCLFSSYFLFWLVEEGAVGNFLLWAGGLLCVPSCMVSRLGFTQIVAGTTCNRLFTRWRYLRPWRQALIVLFFMVVIWIEAPFIYFLFSISPTPPVNSDI